MSQETKVRGVADIVFLIDVTGSMQPCIDALRDNIRGFIETLSSKDANSGSPVRDWRARVVGYRDFPADGEANWLVDNEFVRDASALGDQLSRLVAEGGGEGVDEQLGAAEVLLGEEGARDRVELEARAGGVEGARGQQADAGERRKENESTVNSD